MSVTLKCTSELCQLYFSLKNTIQYCKLKLKDGEKQRQSYDLQCYSNYLYLHSHFNLRVQRCLKIFQGLKGTIFSRSPVNLGPPKTEAPMLYGQKNNRETSDYTMRIGQFLLPAHTSLYSYFWIPSIPTQMTTIFYTSNSVSIIPISMLVD